LLKAIIAHKKQALLLPETFKLRGHNLTTGNSHEIQVGSFGSCEES
jgi:hypothetical protein